jgi:hypothetical protein
MIDYGSSNFLEECRKAYELKAAFGIQIREPGRRAAAIRRQLRLLDGSRDPYPLLLNLIDKWRLIRLWAGMSHAIAARWHLAYYEDERGFEVYFTPPNYAAARLSSVPDR